MVVELMNLPRQRIPTTFFPFARGHAALLLRANQYRTLMEYLPAHVDGKSPFAGVKQEKDVLQLMIVC